VDLRAAAAREDGLINGVIKPDDRFPRSGLLQPALSTPRFGKKPPKGTQRNGPILARGVLASFTGGQNAELLVPGRRDKVLSPIWSTQSRAFAIQCRGSRSARVEKGQCADANITNPEKRPKWANLRTMSKWRRGRKQAGFIALVLYQKRPTPRPFMKA